VYAFLFVRNYSYIYLGTRKGQGRMSTIKSREFNKSSLKRIAEGDEKSEKEEEGKTEDEELTVSCSYYNEFVDLKYPLDPIILENTRLCWYDLLDEFQTLQKNGKNMRLKNLSLDLSCFRHMLTADLMHLTREIVKKRSRKIYMNLIAKNFGWYSCTPRPTHQQHLSNQNVYVFRKEV
jgi:hypothetical protein